MAFVILTNLNCQKILNLMDDSSVLLKIKTRLDRTRSTVQFVDDYKSLNVDIDIFEIIVKLIIDIDPVFSMATCW